MNKTTVTLAQICDELSDGLHKAPVFNPDGEYLFVNATNLENGFIVDKGEGKRADFSEYAKYAIDLNENTILYSIDGTIGNIARYRGEKCILGKGACYLKIKDSVCADYIYYLLQSSLFSGYIKSMSTGSTIHHISLETMRKFSFDLPEYKTQKAIGRILSVLDEKIHHNMIVCSELEAMAKMLYDYWFVQFDFPDANGMPYQASGGEMVWNEQMKREIPKEWEVGTVDDIGSIVSGGTPTTSNETYYTDNGIAWITPNDLSGKEHVMFISHGERDITSEGLSNSSAVLMPKQSVLFSSRAPIGYIAISANEICTNQGFKSIVPNKGYGAYFIYYTIKRNTPAIAKQGVGTTFKEVSGDTLRKFRITSPPKHIASAFENQLNAVFEKRKLLEQENRELTQLRDWLLPMLMNGQVTVELANTIPHLRVLTPDKSGCDPRFDCWLQTRGIAARGNVDEQTLHDIFDAMDDDDKQ